MNSGSPVTLRSVLLPLSPLSRHTNPGLRSARALISSRRAMKSAIGGRVHRRDRPADVQLRDLPAAAHRPQPAEARTTSGIPDGSPAPAQRASDSRANSWSTTIDDAPMTPARPPSDERRISRSRVASGSDRA